jgi:undecaprenyl diphosphate synthase
MTVDPLVPQCIGFIMDGNRRWAKDQGQETIFGHQAGEEKFYEVAQWIKDAHIPHAVFYAFSTENWFRDKLEVAYLEALFLAFTHRMLAEVHDWQVRINVFGDLTGFSDELKTAIADLMHESARYETTTLWMALSYGGRQEIVAAVNAAIAIGKPVDETTLAGYLATAGMPDPDLIIRTGGDMRLSNFLPWQTVYSELMFTPTYWPAFTKEEFTSMLTQYGDRKRRFGR